MDKFQEALKLSEEVQAMSRAARVLAASFAYSVTKGEETVMHWALEKLADDLRFAAIAYDNADIFYRG